MLEIQFKVQCFFSIKLLSSVVIFAGNKNTSWEDDDDDDNGRSISRSSRSWDSPSPYLNIRQDGASVRSNR